MILFADLIFVGGQLPDNRRHPMIHFNVVGGRPGDNQRRPRLVDQDVVDLVDQRESVAALDAVVVVHRHIIAKVIEPINMGTDTFGVENTL